jgi:anti-sigma factor RsiW
VISCDECQEKMVALFDSEGTEDDEALISVHLKECPECRVFREDMIRIRQKFASAGVPSPPAAIEQKVMRWVAAEGPQGKTLLFGKALAPEPWRRRFLRLAWVGGAIAVAVVAVLAVACLFLSEKVDALRHELQIAQRDVAVLRAEKDLKKTQEGHIRERVAISSLELRVRDLEERFQRSSSPRVVSYPEDIFNLSYRGSSL